MTRLRHLWERIDKGPMLAFLILFSTTLYLFYQDSQRTERDQRNRAASRLETCRFIDSEHDDKRAQIVEGERQILGPFRDLFPGLTEQQIRRIHRQNRKHYGEIFNTRPSYCPPRDGKNGHSKPIPPYPSLEKLRQ